MHQSPIRLAGDPGTPDGGWALPAGWVSIVNRLHANLVDVLGDYAVVRVGNKMAALRYAIDRHGDTAEVWAAVNALMEAAKAESLATCDLCGAQAQGRLTAGVTRCTRHQTTREQPIYGALARPPGWRG